MIQLAKGKVRESWRCCCWEKGKFVLFMNSNMVKPEKFGHLHLVYHFTIPLKGSWHDSTLWLHQWKTYKIKGDIFCTTQQYSRGAAEYTIIIHDDIKKTNQRGFKWFKTFRNYQFWKQTTSLAIKKYVLSSHQIK